MTTLEQFETAPGRCLSEAQERRLNRKHCTGDYGPGKWETINSLINAGYLEDTGKALVLTEKAKHYIHHYGPLMPV